jgi:hypothetical protein
MKVESEAVWQDYVKDGKVKGFSIEAYFSDKMSRPKDKDLKEEASQEFIDTIKKILKDA